MSHSELCPVCNGEGKIEKPIGYGDTAVGTEETVCHGCMGNGWITVKDSIQNEDKKAEGLLLEVPVCDTKMTITG